ncbi:hypothetical protein [Sinosporangium siamense]|uniref:Uncharacterized protein n=1 Tax=Sinosporangium siamense TaxID=1367973 RepID=A0A919V9W3_9ACTN|nr:hypothetical protein [Sinosporangium siamense]GII95823.1 hypothetical protein Ssi02_60540 [Sinosporangium siamense]
MIRPFVQGDSESHRRSAIRFAGILALGHIAMAGFFVALIHQVGSVTAAYLPRDTAIAICVAATLIAIGVDFHAIRNNTYSIGLKRQTAKSLAHQEGRPWWLTPLMWGLDTGMIWSTFRVSCTSWVLLLSALLNVAPQWSGLVYGLSFGVPLLAVVIMENLAKSTESAMPGMLRIVQATGLTLLAALPAALILSVYANT